jgi:glycosyltransferase involved in cell wall biosynthesis
MIQVFILLSIAFEPVWLIGWRNVSYHLLGIPYSEANENFSMCAFSMKIVRWCRMLNYLNVSYTAYVNENADPACRNVVTIFSSEERIKYYGDDAHWKSAYFDQRTNSPGAIEWIRRAKIEVQNRKVENDLVLAVFGTMHAEIVHESGLAGIEVGVGYRSTFSNFQVVESYTWQAALAQLHSNNEAAIVSNYHTVIPMCYFPDEFAAERNLVGAPYLAFVARIDVNKGILIALSLLCKLDEVRLKVAGTGNLSHFLEGFPSCRDRVEYVGVLTAKQRNNLIAGAVALLAPTQYLEPFGSVVVESMFLGTPVISSDQGGMSETVQHGVSGFRCRTLGCYAQAAKHVSSLSREQIRQLAMAKFVCDDLIHKHTDFFQDVIDVQSGQGWYTDKEPGYLGFPSVRQE